MNARLFCWECTEGGTDMCGRKFNPMMENLQNLSRLEDLREILGYLAPHASGMHGFSGKFVDDMVVRRARDGDEFFASPKQYAWLLELAFSHGYKAGDDQYWLERQQYMKK
jgi:hypothetical protein